MKSEFTKIEIAVIKEQLMQNSKDHLEIKELICELKTEFKDFEKNCDNRYAPRWVVWFAQILIGIVFTALVGGAIALLFR